VLDKGPGTHLDLADLAPFAWERVCIFGPYTTAGDIRRSVAVAWRRSDDCDIESRDDIDLLVFIHDHEVARFVAHRREYGDFGPELVNRCYARDEAKFLVRVAGPGSWGTIGPSK
jgi:hypothetical protein